MIEKITEIIIKQEHKARLAHRVLKVYQEQQALYQVHKVHQE
jgi:hypothetical protein